MARLPHGKNPEKVVDMVIKLLLPYRRNMLTITTDNGSEFACHKKIAKALTTTVYFADSYASWQKGTIENENKLIRQYIPKGTDFRELTEEFMRRTKSGSFHAEIAPITAHKANTRNDANSSPRASAMVAGTSRVQKVMRRDHFSPRVR